MGEIANLVNTKFDLRLTLVSTPNGRFAFVGKVPDVLAFVDATPEQIYNGRQFGERFGPKRRSFETREEAIIFAHDNNIWLFDITC